MSRKEISTQLLEEYGYSLNAKKLADFYQKGTGKPVSDGAMRWLDATIPCFVMAYQAGMSGQSLEDLFPFLEPIEKHTV